VILNVSREEMKTSRLITLVVGAKELDADRAAADRQVPRQPKAQDNAEGEEKHRDSGK